MLIERSIYLVPKGMAQTVRTRDIGAFGLKMLATEMILDTA